MENAIHKLTRLRTHVSAQGLCQKYFRRDYTEEKPYRLEKEKQIHPYRQIHPWDSLEDFAKSLVQGVIYNKDGLVAINKPYGISSERPPHSEESEKKQQEKMLTPVVNAKSYYLSDAMPYIAKELQYKQLKVVKAPERYMSGLTLLAADEQTETLVQKSYTYTAESGFIPRTYWIVTTRVPREIKGEKYVGLTLQTGPSGVKKAVILHEWSKNSVKKNLVRPLRVEYQMISNSTGNLSSLIEIKASKRKWQALRLFAATEMYSPILGDNYMALRIQKVGDTWMRVSPFAPVRDVVPALDPELLKLLHLTKRNQEIIPVHIHLREFFLRSFARKHNDLRFVAPLLPPFDWTCQQLKFKLPDEKTDGQDNKENVEHTEEKTALSV